MPHFTDDQPLQLYIKKMIAEQQEKKKAECPSDYMRQYYAHTKRHENTVTYVR